MRWLAVLIGAVALASWAPAQAQTPVPDALADPIYTPRPLVSLTHPEWSRNAVLYQLNTRQFTPVPTCSPENVRTC